MTLKEKIKTAQLKLEKVNVPEWDTDVYLSRMSGTERDIFDTEQLKAKAEEKTKGNIVFQTLQPLLLSICLCDASGKKLFDKPEEVQSLDSVVLDRLATLALKINALTQEAKVELEKKDLVKTTSGAT
jgi:hypothetical protein